MTFDQSLNIAKEFFSDSIFNVFFDRYQTILMKEWNSINGRKFRVPFEQLMLNDSSNYLASLDEVNMGTLVSEDQQELIKTHLLKLGPWRKGPFTISDVFIDSEWCSNLKWDRLSQWIADELTGKVVADIGCGSGYYMYRSLAYNPRFIMGVDPSLLFNFQFHTLQHFGRDERAVYLQSRLEELAPFSHQFDTVICMGVLYHRRDPLCCLTQLKQMLKKGSGTCILETLIIPGDSDDVLNPESRYAKMPNVHYIPTLNRLKKDLIEGGFVNCDVIDINQTTITEQRATEWSTPTSLASFLEPGDNNKTVEGYPAPTRVVLRVSNT